MKIYTKTILYLVLITLLSIPTICSELKGDFKRVGEWKFEDIIPRLITVGLVDNDGELVGSLFTLEKGLLAISPGKLSTFAKRGEGPSDIMGIHCFTDYHGDIAVLELAQAGRMKIFTKKNGKYTWKETKWFKTDKNTQVPAGGIFFRNKWLFAGLGFYNTGEKFYLKPVIHTFSVKIYDDNGNKLKELVKRDFKGQTNYHNMSYYILPYKDKAFYASEHELNIKVICPDKLEVVKDINLEKPAFYKAIPPEFYGFKDYQGDSSKYLKDLQHWRVSYSRINQLLVEGDHLVIQVRTCGDKMKRFALLFYNAGTFKLEKTVFIDDILLAARDGRYYCYKSGDPYLDEDADECTINIYSFK